MTKIYPFVNEKYKNKECVHISINRLKKKSELILKHNIRLALKKIRKNREFNPYFLTLTVFLTVVFK